MSRPRILLIGNRGMLGRAWGQRLTAAGLDYVAASDVRLDITDRARIDRVVAGYDLVVNCAAWTHVDDAEFERTKARELNVVAVGHLAERCRETGATLIHYSTDYVFNGQASEPYPVDAPHDPINMYGKTKAEGERRLWDSGADHLLIRTSWLHAPWGHNFVRTMVRLGAEREKVRVVDDQVGRPTSAPNLARASLELYRGGHRGTFHVTDSGQCTWYDLACRVIAASGGRCRVEPCPSSEYPRPAKRPRYSVLDISATEARIGPLPPWTRAADAARPTSLSVPPPPDAPRGAAPSSNEGA
ncbi:MAG: dTDP-4-dehydrorhamnose reductase [Myxococcales bacterium]|nr:dTDP-4-dehydrorhamnose reductase [Myxococcales bacterium]